MTRLFYNGKVYLEREKFAQAVLVEDSIIKAVGTDDELLKLCQDSTEKIDLNGKTMVPGFIDSHMHLYNVGESLNSLNLYDAKSIAEVISMSKKYITDNSVPDGQVVLGKSWNQDYFKDENRILNRDDLDKISTVHPLVFPRTCGHIAALNTKALEVLGIDENYPPVDGGTIEKDENGKLTGVLTENALNLVTPLRGNVTPEQRENLIKLGMEHANKHGITSVHSNDVHDDLAYETLDAYDNLYKKGLSTVRQYHQCLFTTLEPYKKFVEKGYVTGKGNDMIKIGPLKMLLDGSLGARTAKLRQEYADAPGVTGILCFTQEQLDEMVQTATDNNMQVAVHTIGDKACEMILNSYSKVINDGKNPLRHGIVHCQITDMDLLNRFKEMDIFAYVQPIFLHYDLHIVEDRVGKQLASTSYAFGTMEKLGLHIGYGTDAPIEDLNTMNCIHCAVNRKDLNNYPDGGWFANEAVDVYQAVDNYTTGSAYASFDEDKKGRIKKGYLADFAVLDQDIFTVDKSKIKEINVCMTVLGGNTVYEK